MKTVDEDLRSPPNFAITAAIFEGALALAAVFLGWWLDHPPMDYLSFSFGELGLGVLAVVPMLGLLGLGLWLPIRPFCDVMRVVDRMLVPLFRQCTVVEMACISLLAGLSEEMLFRGVLQSAVADALAEPLRAWGGSGQAADWAAAAGVAVVFGLMHAVNRSYALLAAVIGLYLGALWNLTGNLIVPITAHALYDFLALVYFVNLRGRAVFVNNDCAQDEKRKE